MSHDDPFHRTWTLSLHRHSMLGALVGLLCVLAWPGASLAELDICGCIGHPQNRGDFDAHNTATYPPGTTRSGNAVTLLLRDDGVLIFSSFTVPSGFVVSFAYEHDPANPPANTPAMLLVSGNVTVDGQIDVSGDPGGNGTAALHGIGGAAGPGGFPGGDGAYQAVNSAKGGGTGLGPGGGTAGTATPLAAGGPATFIGMPELLPLVGGSGGGGGASSSNANNCSGGGGGGGGGALLIAANGTMTIDGSIKADGGAGGLRGSNVCASIGGAGSGGAIRLVAHTMAGIGSLFASGGNALAAQVGSIRLEAFTIANTLAASNTSPHPVRVSAPGPISNPLTPTVEITQVGGQTVPSPPQGVFRGVDVILPAPGPVTVRLATSGVPSGTAVNLTIKPRVGGALPPLPPITLANCTAAGDCDETVVVNLPSGQHVIEALATFQP